MLNSFQEVFRSFVLGSALVCALAVTSPFAQSAAAQNPTPPLATTPAPTTLDVAAMQTELARLKGICDSLNLTAEAELCERWTPVERTDQSLLFLPVAPQQASVSNPKQAAWVKHFETARVRHAEYWFEKCRAAIEAGDEIGGYQLLWRTLRENPQHTDAKRTLGRLATSATVRPVVRRSTGKHPTFNWPGSSYTRVESPHFYLTSRASTAETIELGTQLEEFYSLWTQFFYPLWAPPGLLKSRLSGGTAPFETQRQIKVVLLRDRADYIETLGTREENIGVSVGYYDPSSQTSYFFPDKNLAATFYHELTHQLLAEATRLNTAEQIGSQGDAWLLEGIALYMESLSRTDGYWTLGGWESPRLQTARYRAIRDGSFEPWAEFSKGQLNQWKSDPDISQLYSQAAGITHAMLDSFHAPDQREDRKQILFQALVSLYQGAPNSGRILKELGDAEIPQRYESDLTVASEQVTLLRTDRPLEELVLAGSELSTEAWQKISQLKSLEWLDLSFTNATSEALRSIGNLRQLERLSVEGTSVNGELFDELRGLTKLSDLDLTGCPVNDADIKKLVKLPQLTTLWLGKTQITEASLATFANMPKLQYVDFAETKISPDAWANFVQRNPRFRKSK